MEQLLHSFDPSWSVGAVKCEELRRAHKYQMATESVRKEEESFFKNLLNVLPLFFIILFNSYLFVGNLLMF